MNMADRNTERSNASDKLEPFLDVEKAIQEWGILRCEDSARTRKQKRMKKRQFVHGEMVMDVQIDWSHLSVSYNTVWGELVDGDFRKSAKGGAENAATEENENVQRMAKTLKPSEDKGTDVNVLFETDFKNDTDVAQQYTLKIEKTTNSSCTTEIEHGVTNGIELNATLSIGDVLEVGTGFSHEVSLNKVEGETLETQVTWGAESTVTVLPQKRATAEMQVLEKQQSSDFLVFTTMTGYVIIKYTSIKDGTLVFGHSGKIDTIIRDYIKEMKNRGKKFVGIEYPGDSKVQFQTKGKCRFRYGVKQVVSIVQDNERASPKKK